MTVGTDIVLSFKEAIRNGDKEAIEFFKEELYSQYDISEIIFSDLGKIVIVESEDEN